MAEKPPVPDHIFVRGTTRFIFLTKLDESKWRYAVLDIVEPSTGRLLEQLSAQVEGTKEEAIKAADKAIKRLPKPGEDQPSFKHPRKSNPSREELRRKYWKKSGDLDPNGEGSRDDE